jgi:hypothetical protein
MNDSNATNLPLNTNLLVVADALVEARNLEVLHALHRALTKLILGNVTRASLVEINEYVSEALVLLEGGRSPEEIRVSSIRELLDEC